MQPVGDLLRVAFVVEAQQAVEDLAAGGFAQSVAPALLGVMETVAEIEIGLAIGGGNGLVQFAVQGAQFGDVGAGLVWVVEAVVGVKTRKIIYLLFKQSWAFFLPILPGLRQRDVPKPALGNLMMIQAHVAAQGVRQALG